MRRGNPNSKPTYVEKFCEPKEEEHLISKGVVKRRKNLEKWKRNPR